MSKEEATAIAKSKTELADIETITNDILAFIDSEREREIISRRFGLHDRKETLEQIGELLGITRERVRQLEKAIVIRLKIAAEKDLPHIKEVEQQIILHLKNMGNIARVSDVTSKITKENSRLDQSRISFMAEIAPNLTVIEDNDHYYMSIGLTDIHNEDKIKELVSSIIEAIKKYNEPVTIDKVTKSINHDSNAHTSALASVSKNLANLHDKWGLTKWPLVNPKNIRDKIFVILHKKAQPMHFNEISEAIKDSEFKRKNVTTQAIHNELIKDDRFVLIGRGIYALKEWGYEKGTVSDMIKQILLDNGGPMHRDEIVKKVLQHRQVKETTILLNLQGKPQFKRVAKATYDYDASREK